MLRPRMCLERAGYIANSRAMLVKAPVATSHAVFGGHLINAWYISSIALHLTNGDLSGLGRRSVPSSPESPTDIRRAFVGESGLPWISAAA